MQQIRMKPIIRIRTHILRTCDHHHVGLHTHLHQTKPRTKRYNVCSIAYPPHAATFVKQSICIILRRIQLVWHYSVDRNLRGKVQDMGKGIPLDPLGSINVMCIQNAELLFLPPSSHVSHMST